MLIAQVALVSQYFLGWKFCLVLKERKKKLIICCQLNWRAPNSILSISEFRTHSTIRWLNGNSIQRQIRISKHWMSRALFIRARLSSSFLSVCLFHAPFDSYVCHYSNTLCHFTFEWRDSRFGCFFGICNIVTSLRFKCCPCFFLSLLLLILIDFVLQKKIH